MGRPDGWSSIFADCPLTVVRGNRGSESGGAPPPHNSQRTVHNFLGSGGSPCGPARESHRKNKTTITAGIAGAHQVLSPNAERDEGPSLMIMNMMALAHANALMKLRPENVIALTPEY